MAQTMQTARQVTGTQWSTVPVSIIDITPEIAKLGVESALEVVVGRATMIVAQWEGGMTVAGTYCGGGSQQAARAKALQRAIEAGLRLKARWPGAA